MKKQFDAILACRVGGTRLYGKPLQLLDINNRVTILEYLVKYIQQSKHINSIALAIAEGRENYGFAELAEKQGWQYVFGEEDDMLGRVLKAIDKFGTEVVLLDSTESPFLYYEHIDKLYEEHVKNAFDLSLYSDLPDGAGYSIINAEVLGISHAKGSSRHRELLTSYVFDNQENFRINIQKPEEKLKRSDIRITVDYPEDLVFCRKIYNDLNGAEKMIEISDIIDHWDKNPDSRRPLEQIGVDWGHGRIWA